METETAFVRALALCFYTVDFTFYTSPTFGSIMKSIFIGDTDATMVGCVTA